MKTRIFTTLITQLILTNFFAGTIIGTCLGILGTTINNRRRMKELRQIVTDSTKIHSTAAIAAAAAVPTVIYTGTGNAENSSNEGGEIREISAETSAAITAASVSASAAATAKMVLPALEDQQKQLETVAGQFINILEVLEKKISKLDDSIKNQPEPVIKVATPKVDITGLKAFKELQNTLMKQNTNLLEGQNKLMQSRDQELQNNILKQSTNLLESQNRVMNIRDQKFLNALKSTNSESYTTFSSRMCDIEEKVKDIRSLLLAQAMSSSDSVISSSVKIHEAAKEAAKAVEKSNENVFGMVNDMESSLKEHEERLNSQLLAAGVVVAVSVPVVSYIINKLL